MAKERNMSDSDIQLEAEKRGFPKQLAETKLLLPITIQQEKD